MSVADRYLDSVLAPGSRRHPGQEYLDAADAQEDERRAALTEQDARREVAQREADRQRARDHHARRRLARGGTR